MWYDCINYYERNDNVDGCKLGFHQDFCTTGCSDYKEKEKEVKIKLSDYVALKKDDIMNENDIVATDFGLCFAGKNCETGKKWNKTSNYPRYRLKQNK